MNRHPSDLSVFHLYLDSPVDPAAGAQYATTLPPFIRFELQSVALTFASAVAAANRRINVIVGTGAAPWFNFSCPTILIASQFYSILFGRGLESTIATILATHRITVPLGEGLICPGDCDITINIENIQAADQLANIRITGRKWRDVPASF